MVMNIQVKVFWLMTPFNDVAVCQCFGGRCCIHVLDEVKMEAPWCYETLVSYHITNSVKTQKMI